MAKSRFEKLNKNKPYGTVHGVGVKHSFEQNGFPYDFHGNLMHSEMNAEAKSMLARAEATAAADEAADKARRSAMRKAGFDLDEATPKPASKREASAEVDDDDDDEIDLVGWARGTAQYPFEQVQNAILDKHSVQVPNEDEARRLVLHEG